MAASSAAGRILTLCKRFEGVIRFSTGVNAQPCSINASKFYNQFCRERSPPAGPSWFGQMSSVNQCRSLHTTSCRRGLEEFFDLPENWGESTVKSGDSWTAAHLRTKSNEDLHKLWYVLLKEKNMLLTIEQEAKRQRLQMPSPERLRKIELSILRLESVAHERETALRLLQTGQEKGRPGAWRSNVFGYTYWYRFKEYAIPWYMNRKYKGKRFYTPSFVQPYIRLRVENYLRDKNRKKKMEMQTLAKLKEKFPHMKVSSSS
ncbi:large ribosomal subunit protein uL29m [Cynoglossus semilaevis]|uniref:Large ribosomal subunit protein uL29m n=1 Tax=Cynoglossus semilaevis TaxID=244447 RepID=A0A3P8W6L9_CYNSE|nr:39S ribosomal protein L47, mitochondrial [Cynoglossus semilaevis]